MMVGMASEISKKYAYKQWHVQYGAQGAWAPPCLLSYRPRMQLKLTFFSFLSNNFQANSLYKIENSLDYTKPLCLQLFYRTQASLLAVCLIQQFLRGVKLRGVVQI